MRKRNTKQKELVINYLKENKDKHLTVEEVLFNFKKQNADISQATVYRILSNLVEEGAIRKYIASENKCSCYQYIDNEKKCNNHYHLMCDKCGQIVHFESNELINLKENLLNDKSFDLNLQKVVLYGKCNKCREEKE